MSEERCFGHLIVKINLDSSKSAENTWAMIPGEHNDLFSYHIGQRLEITGIHGKMAIKDIAIFANLVLSFFLKILKHQI